MQWLSGIFLFAALVFGAAQQFPNQFGGFGQQQFPNQFGGQQYPNQFGGQQQFPNQFPNQFGNQQQFPNQFGGQQQFPNQFGGQQQQFGGQQPFANQLAGFPAQQPQSQNQFGDGSQQFNPLQPSVATTPSAQTPAFPTTTAAAPAATTPGPEYYRCIDQCPTLSQYSPLCGSDGNAYHNDQKLACANQCGRRSNPNWQEIVALRAGSCTPGGRPFVPSPIV